MRVLWSAVCAIYVVAASSVSLAQQSQVESSPHTSGREGRGDLRTATNESRNASRATDADQMIAIALLLGNQEEVALAEFAQKRSQTPEVREFAAMMIKDHQPAVDKLQQLAPSMSAIGSDAAAANAGASAAANQSNAPNSNRSRSAERGSISPTSPSGESTMPASSSGGSKASATAIAFQQQTAARCLELTMEELGELEGEEFDMAYLGQQIVAHVSMLAKLETAAQMSSGDLQSFAAQSIPTVKHHHMMAKQMKKQLKAASAGSTSASVKTPSASRH
jgi:predicted outer membrane protein